ncbi:DUF4377 domain-containing protein, partial [Aeromonas caviae]|uniref:DUF4377 domain-containing protein n=1 Tax=Aeromonas caviae TaxID=648 RepID=UPI003754AC85
MKSPLLLSSALLLSACQSAPTTETLYIQDKLADCVGVAPMKCMQVRSQPGESWSLFYQQIEGFTRHSAPDLGINLPIALTQY